MTKDNQLAILRVDFPSGHASVTLEKTLDTKAHRILLETFCKVANEALLVAGVKAPRIGITEEYSIPFDEDNES